MYFLSLLLLSRPLGLATNQAGLCWPLVSRHAIVCANIHLSQVKQILSSTLGANRWHMLQDCCCHSVIFDTANRHQIIRSIWSILVSLWKCVSATSQTVVKPMRNVCPPDDLSTQQFACSCLRVLILLMHAFRPGILNSFLSTKESALAYGDVAVIVCAATSTSYCQAISNLWRGWRRV